MTNEIVPPTVPCDECMNLFSSGFSPTDHLAVYCCHNSSFAIYSPDGEEWEMRSPVAPGEVGKWIERKRNYIGPALWDKRKKRRREAEGMALALDRLEASASGFSGAN